VIPVLDECSPNCATVNRFEGGAAATGDWHGLSASGRNLPHAQPTGPVGVEVDPMPVARPGGNQIIGTAVGEPARGTSVGWYRRRPTDTSAKGRQLLAALAVGFAGPQSRCTGTVGFERDQLLRLGGVGTSGWRSRSSRGCGGGASTCGRRLRRLFGVAHPPSLVFGGHISASHRFVLVLGARVEPLEQ
jgi:hypothetical protein